MLGHPGDVEADRFGELHHFDRIVEDLRPAMAVALGHQAEKSELHVMCSLLQIPTMVSPPLGLIT